MKQLIFAVLAMGLSSAAMADGFVCQTNDGALNVKVYNHVHAAQGTRTPAVMVLSDNSRDAGDRTLAVLQSGAEMLVSYGADIDGLITQDIQSEVSEAGIALSTLKAVELKVDYNYSQPVAAGEELSAVLSLMDSSQRVTNVAATCTRYLRQQ